MKGDPGSPREEAGLRRGPSPQRTSKKALGNLGEGLAATRLEELGYRILERNFRCPAGEVDIVALEGGVLAFVEVRTRSSRVCGTPAESVTPLKRRKMRRVARWYLASRQIPPWTPVRFDVIGVQVYAGEEARVDVIRSAF